MTKEFVPYQYASQRNSHKSVILIVRDEKEEIRFPINATGVSITNTPLQRCYKSGDFCKYACSGLCKEC